MVKIKNPMTIVSSGGSATLVSKTITANGQYNPADDNADGYSDVTVAVPAPANKFKSLVDRSITSVTADDLRGVTTIGESAFNGCKNIISAVLPDSVTTIGTNAFRANVKLESVVFGNSVSTVMPYAFGDNTKLKTIILPASVNNIYSNAFRSCTAMESITILATTPPTLENANAFNGTNNCPIYVPAASVNAYKTETNWSALADRIQPILSEGLSFSVDSEQGIATVTGIGTCTDTDIVIPNEHKGYAVTAIGYEAFRANTGITSVIIPTSVTSIKSYAFNGCTGLISIDIPNSVTEIGWYAFSGCNGLTSAIIGNGILKIYGYAFRGCSNLVGITILATTPPTISDVSAFESTDDCPIYVPYSADHSVLNAYKTATNWSAFADRIFEIQE